MARRIMTPTKVGASEVHCDTSGDIHQVASMVDQARRLGVEVDVACWWRNEFVGSPEALIEAGILTAEQVPGAFHANKVSATYYGGKLCRRGQKPPKDEKYFSVVRRTKNKLVVSVGLHAAERDRRYNEIYNSTARQSVAGARQQDRHSMTADDFRQAATDSVLILWRLITMNTRDSAYPFALGERDVERVRLALLDAHAILSTAPILSLRKASDQLDRARGDVVFQAFLETQGLKADLEANHE